jgi:hypothetical protein
MGIVSTGKIGANSFRDFCDFVFTKMRSDLKVPDVSHFSLQVSTIVGVLTLEDIIEGTLRIDINDESDRSSAIQAL